METVRKSDTNHVQWRHFFARKYIMTFYWFVPFVDSFVNSDWLNLVVSFLTNELVNQAVRALWLRCIVVVKRKTSHFAFWRGRVNISGGSEIAWINVECNGDSLSVAVLSKVKKCYSSVTNSLLGGNWRDSERIETTALPKNLFI